MNRGRLGWLTLLLLLPAGAQEDPTGMVPPPEPARVLEGRFATSGVCAMCHSVAPVASALRDADGRSVAPFDLWRASMMANSARDPLWRAQVAAEVAAVGSAHAREVVAECLGCHAPMAAHEARLNGEPPVGIEVLDDPGPRGALARDGASCTVCHQVEDRDLGQPSTFGGNPPLGEARKIWGPHEGPQPGPMRRHTRYEPTHGPHILRSAVCATCHTLFTGPEKTVPEQTPYLEWRSSVFQDEVAPVSSEARSCQACHVPVDESLETRIARNPAGRDFPFVKPRRPIGRHLFLGGNVLVPAILRDHARELGVEAPREAFDAVLKETRAQLETRSARLTIEQAARREGRIEARVRLENLAGHKLPTGIPVRRMWLRARVLDRAGRALFALGEHDAAGRIVGADGAPLPAELAGGPIHPHRDRVRGPDEVPVWEAVLADEAGRATFRLRLARGHLKDDRLLPRGWNPAHPDAAAIAPVGVEGDADFAGGADRLALDLPVAVDGPLRLEVALLYQPLGARWAAELFTVDDPAVARFRRYWESADRAPVVLAAASVDVP